MTARPFAADAVFTSVDALVTRSVDLPRQDASVAAAAEARNAALTKPEGALGRLEALAVWFAGWRGRARPQGVAAQALVFAGTHGVAARGVSAYPPEVTAQMVANFERGGAAINQIVDLVGAPLTVAPLDLETPTDDFTRGPAMSEAAFLEAVGAGWSAVDDQCDCLILGEMGIGNTTAASAVAAALFGGAAEDWCGRGTGLDDAGLARKIAVVSDGLSTHRAAIDDAPPERRGFEALRRLGGREMAAIMGATLRARHLSAPVILDGFIVGASVAPLAAAAPNGLAHCLAGHVSAEAGHKRLLEALRLDPLLDLGLRLGEASGAALAFGILQCALACHAGMATFDEAGVSGRG